VSHFILNGDIMANTKAFIMVEFPQNTIDDKKFQIIIRNLKNNIHNLTGYKIPVQSEYEEIVNNPIIKKYDWII